MSILDILKKYGIESEAQLSKVLQQLSQSDKVNLVQALEAAFKYDFKKYIPQNYQYPLHTADAYIRAMIAGNRTGKTFGCMHDLLWYLTGQYPGPGSKYTDEKGVKHEWEFPEHLKRETPFYGRWIATDFKHGIGEVFMPEFKKIVPGPYKDGPVVKRVSKNQTGVWTSIEFQNGSTETLMTNEQDVDDFEGASYHRLDVDEPCSHSRFIASCRGLVDYDGRVCMHLTPLTEPWIYSEIFTKADGKNIFVVQAKMSDNKFNTKQAMDKFSSQMDCDPDEQEARMEGAFKHLKGLVYKCLDRDVHKTKSFHIFNNYPVVHVMDPHDRKPHTHIWAAIDPHNHYHVVGEMEQHGTVLETSHAIKLYERRNDLRVSLRIGDPNKFKAPAAVGLTGSLRSEFAKYGLHFYTNVNDKIADGHHAVRQKLHWNKKLPRRLGNQPALYFVEGKADQCFNEMLKYVYYEDKDPDSRGLKEKPKEAHKDFPDCIRYLVMAAPVYESINHNPIVDVEPDTRNKTTGY